MFIFYNPNPERNLASDCTVRAICKLTGKKWLDVYFGICLQGAIMFDMPSTNRVWEEYLKRHGFRKTLLPDTCPMCYTVRDFCYD